MEEFLTQFFSQLHGGLLALVIVVSLGVLGKAADWLVDEAVTLSERSGIPKAVIGATVVSLGTTTPEAAVSVFAAMQGSPGLALGNAVGSIICNAGLILGLACLLAPLKLDRVIVRPWLDSTRHGGGFGACQLSYLRGPCSSTKPAAAVRTRLQQMPGDQR